MTSRIIVRAVFVLAVLAAMLVMPARAQKVDKLKEAQVKAGYLVNFLRYTDFPEAGKRAADSKYRIVIIGDDALASALRTAAREGITVNARELEVSSGLSLGEAPGSDARPSHLSVDLVFIDRSRRAYARTILDALAGQPILTVGDAEDFARAGGMIGLSLEDARIVFDANPAAIRKSGLMVSARVLKLARRLEGEGAP